MNRITETLFIYTEMVVKRLPAVFIIPLLLFQAAHAEIPAKLNLHPAVREQGCMACHGLHEQRIGPAFAWVAVRYPDADAQTRQKLASKIIEGGAGAWGVVPMIPHPHISREEANEIVEWILTRKPSTQTTDQ